MARIMKDESSAGYHDGSQLKAGGQVFKIRQV
jgi:hypothetical protein